MDDARKAIIDGRFKEFKKRIYRKLYSGKNHEWIKAKVKMDKLEDFLKYSVLFMYYGELFSKKQKSIWNCIWKMIVRLAK